MHATPRPRLEGVVPPVCTPLTETFDLDVASLEHLIDFLLAAGVHGLFFLGSTSEAAFLTDQLRKQVLDVAVSRVAGAVPVLAGAIDTATLRVHDGIAMAAKAGADGVVVTAPFYTRTHEMEIERHFELLAEQAELPIYAYDVPVAVHSKLDAQLLMRLARKGVIHGVKDSSGDESGLRRLLLAKRAAGLENFSILTGAEETVDLAMRMGADGVVPGLGNVDPDGYVRLYQCCREGQWENAAAEQERLIRLFEIITVAFGRMGTSSSALGAFKAALHLRGIIASPTTAPPQIALNDEETAKVSRLLHNAGLL